MKIDLSGKTALVTGSTAGIGLAIAKHLAAAGADVIVNGRGQDKVDAAVKAIAATKPAGKISGVTADVATEAGCNALAAGAPDVDIHINKTGNFEVKDFFDIGDQEWSRFFEVNVLSGVRLARAYMKGMLKRNWGRIVFISSESGVNIPVDMIHYGMTKSAQLSVSRGLAKLTKGSGVTVNSVLPGPTLTEGVEVFLKGVAKQNNQSEEAAAANFVKQHRPSSLAQRFASVDEIANIVVFVASKEAAMTNGAAVRAEGGILDTIA
jgi:NAD(P)-dependent dehydrogenase (short-subunit alcohol dehydrogenase family)